MHWSGERASLTLTHANKEDEGLYTLRVVMGEYYEEYSGYVFVRGRILLMNHINGETRKPFGKVNLSHFRCLFPIHIYNFCIIQ